MSGSDVAIITQERFALAWPEQQARSRTLTEIWIASFKSQHTRACYRRDLNRWLDWCVECDTRPDEARKAHTDLWIEKQRREGAAEASIARRVSAVASWYDYLIDNTGDTASPLAVRNPAKTRARPRIDPDYSPTVGLSRAEADRLIEAADKDGYTTSALVRLLLVNGLRVGSAIDARIENLGHDRGHRVLDLTRKGGYRDRVAIPPAVGEPIDAMLAWRGSPAHGWLFVLRNGRQVYEVWVWRLVRELGARAADPTSGRPFAALPARDRDHRVSQRWRIAGRGSGLRQAQGPAHNTAVQQEPAQPGQPWCVRARWEVRRAFR